MEKAKENAESDLQFIQSTGLFSFYKSNSVSIFNTILV